MLVVIASVVLSKLALTLTFKHQTTFSPVITNKHIINIFKSPFYHSDHIT